MTSPPPVNIKPAASDDGLAAATSVTSGLNAEEVREMKRRLFHQLQPGMRVLIVRRDKLDASDICVRRPELNNAVAEICSVPVYPNTWLSVRLVSTNEQIKVRSSNISVPNASGNHTHVQTERLSKSRFFHRLVKGTTIIVMPKKSSKIKKEGRGGGGRALRGFSRTYGRQGNANKRNQPATSNGAAEEAEAQGGTRAIITAVPKYPSTWLTARTVEGKRMIKLRTSQIAAVIEPEEGGRVETTAAATSTVVAAAAAAAPTQETALTDFANGFLSTAITSSSAGRSGGYLYDSSSAGSSYNMYAADGGDVSAENRHLDCGPCTDATLAATTNTYSTITVAADANASNNPNTTDESTDAYIKTACVANDRGSGRHSVSNNSALLHSGASLLPSRDHHSMLSDHNAHCDNIGMATDPSAFIPSDVQPMGIDGLLEEHIEESHQPSSSSIPTASSPLSSSTIGSFPPSSTLQDWRQPRPPVTQQAQPLRQLTEHEERQPQQQQQQFLTPKHQQQQQQAMRQEEELERLTRLRNDIIPGLQSYVAGQNFSSRVTSMVAIGSLRKNLENLAHNLAVGKYASFAGCVCDIRNLLASSGLKEALEAEVCLDILIACSGNALS